ncbi:FAD/NAD(P)-binding protein [Myceligenerans sp. TRM 65318]|uniref:FAD/NAD(P)-binding protein n=1 Tax=Myceligenerans pegani TaxID=2776917 RepID=A0ABR9MVM5_9MICO|nr:FAD/NAD(P)-binding protein [Myceligenerans sp. TRM 65318]MBE3017721.1 FAD/NAD(P)-binding protein [Myceligenerans sp. TRM 65318]
MTGIAMVVQLLATLDEGARIVVIDPEDSRYPSVFYDPEDLVIVNTSAHVGSIVAADPTDFLSYLDHHQDPHAVPRHVVGRYADQRLAHHVRRAGTRGVAVARIIDTVRSIARRGRRYLLRLGSGRLIGATDVVLAMGAGPRRDVAGIRGIGPYPTDRLRSARAHEALVVGTGQSAIDAALVLADSGARVTMSSRTGLLPAVRTRTLLNEQGLTLDLRAPTFDLEATLDRFVQAHGHGPLATMLSAARDPIDRLGEEIALAESGDIHWQDALVAVALHLSRHSPRSTGDSRFTWRYLTSMMLTTAHRLRHAIDDRAVRLVPWAHVAPQRHDVIVVAAGNERYPIACTPDAIHLGSAPAGATPWTTLTESLQVQLPGRTQPERVWAVGPTTAVRYSTANFLGSAVAQSARIAHRIGNAT